MVVKIFRLFIFLLFPTVVFGQSLNVSATPETADNNSTTFLLDGSKVDIGSSTVRFLDTNTEKKYDALGISSDYSVISTLTWNGEEGEIALYDSRGNLLNAFSTVSLADEASFGIYPLGNGTTVLRDKIANFTFYDLFGAIITSMSSSSQSEEGEAISEVAISKTGKTVVIYNPKIRRNGELGSKAQVKSGQKSFEDIFFSSDRYLKDVTISEDGSLIAAITARRGTDDQVLIMDRYGNELNTISVEEDLKKTSFSKDLKYITIYSGGRVMVYSTLDGEILGATSVSSPIVLADYFPEDNLILMLTGNYSDQSGIVNGAEFRAINLEQRSIASQPFGQPIGLNSAINIQIERNSPNSYMLNGATKQIRIDANF